MANGRRGSRGRARGRAGQVIRSGMVAGSNGDLVSQSGGIARTFQATNGSGQNKYGPGSTGKKSADRTQQLNNGTTVGIFAPGGDSANLRSARKGTPSASLNTSGNKGPTNTSIVLPRVLGPKGFGGNYRLSKGY